MLAKAKHQQYVILPSRGLVADASNLAAERLLSSLHGIVGAGAFHKPALAAGTGPEMRVLDSIHENGAKLVAMAPESISRLRARQPGIRVVPVVYYRRAIARPCLRPGVKIAAAATAVRIRIRVVSAQDNKPVRGIRVVAFTNFQQRLGAEATTNAHGEAAMALGGATRKVERLYMFANSGFWSGLRRQITLRTGLSFALTAIELSFTDCVRHRYGQSPIEAGQGVKVGVIDSGIAPHPDLVIDGGRNTVLNEKPSDFGDNGAEGHGTHVAGIIAARRAPPQGIRGVAPGITLRSYRVFGKGADSASNFAIAKAIDAAVSDNCDLINMSLGGGSPDEVVSDAIADARGKGALVLAANGNDNRAPVSFPASVDLCLAVSAFGRKGTFPRQTDAEGDVAVPFGGDKNDFIAAFSNIGEGTDVTGPGVGVISTVPAGFGVMSGTSMACPAETGAAARVLAKRADVLSMARGQARSDTMAHAVLSAARSLGFGPLFEGQGVVR